MSQASWLPPKVLQHIKLDVPTGCWLWQGSVGVRGYGQVGVNYENWPVHRLVWLFLRGSLTDGLQLDHLCRVRHCCNPAHLEEVTCRTNIRRGLQSKLTTEKRALIDKLHAEGKSQSTIAKAVGVSQPTICCYLRKVHWKD